MRLVRILTLSLMIGLAPACLAQAHVAKHAPSKAFAPLQQWKAAIVAGDENAFRALYSTDPPAIILTPQGEMNTDGETDFWIKPKVRSLKLDVQKSHPTGKGLLELLLQAEMQTAAEEAPVYVSFSQQWQQQKQGWRIVALKRSIKGHLQQPTSLENDIYHLGTDAHAEVKSALARATKENKHVLLIFGANWCYDCHVLDIALHRPDLAPVLAESYETVHVDVGRGDKNQDLMAQYQVPMKRGIPGIAVLDSDGKLLYSQKNGEFENARSLAPQDLLQFLNQWKPQPH